MKTPFNLLILLLVLITSCEKNNLDATIKGNQWDIVNIKGSNSSLAGDTIQISVFYPTSSGCDVLDRFENTINGNTYMVSAFGHTEKAMCIQYAGIKSAIYKFTTKIKGTYNLCFQRRDGSLLNHNLTIN